MESNEKEKVEELIGTVYSRELAAIYNTPVMAFEQILIAFFGCIPFEETTSLDLFEKNEPSLLGKSTAFHKENKKTPLLYVAYCCCILMNIWINNQNSKSKT